MIRLCSLPFLKDLPRSINRFCRAGNRRIRRINRQVLQDSQASVPLARSRILCTTVELFRDIPPLVFELIYLIFAALPMWFGIFSYKYNRFLLTIIAYRYILG